MNHWKLKRTVQNKTNILRIIVVMVVVVVVVYLHAGPAGKGQTTSPGLGLPAFDLHAHVGREAGRGARRRLWLAIRHAGTPVEWSRPTRAKPYLELLLAQRGAALFTIDLCSATNPSASLFSGRGRVTLLLLCPVEMGKARLGLN